MKKQISNTWELKKNLGMVEILLNKIKGKKKKNSKATKKSKMGPHKKFKLLYE